MKVLLAFLKMSFHSIIFLCSERRKPEIILSALFSLLAVSNQKKTVASNNQKYPANLFTYFLVEG